jgi:hypothetical protein
MIVRLARAVLRTGRFLAVWKWGSGVVIQNPGTDDYTTLMASLSISLFTCMGKVVEKVAAELLSADGERSGLLSEGQFRSREGQSAIDAVAIMVTRAHAALTNGHITGVLIKDIKAAFSSGAKCRLVNLMNVRQMDADFLRWTECFLWERTVEMIIEGNTMERHPVEEGVPQGFPVSLIVFPPYTTGLFKWVEEYVSQAEGLSVVDHLR